MSEAARTPLFVVRKGSLETGDSGPMTGPSKVADVHWIHEGWAGPRETILETDHDSSMGRRRWLAKNYGTIVGVWKSRGGRRKGREGGREREASCSGVGTASYVGPHTGVKGVPAMRNCPAKEASKHVQTKPMRSGRWMGWGFTGANEDDRRAGQQPQWNGKEQDHGSILHSQLLGW